MQRTWAILKVKKSKKRNIKDVFDLQQNCLICNRGLFWHLFWYCSSCLSRVSTTIVVRFATFLYIIFFYRNRKNLEQNKISVCLNLGDWQLRHLFSFEKLLSISLGLRYFKESHQLWCLPKWKITSFHSI